MQIDSYDRIEPLRITKDSNWLQGRSEIALRHRQIRWTYLQGLAWFSIASMVIHPIVFDRVHLDLSFIFSFWAGEEIRQYNPTARKWVIGISGLVIVVLIAMAIQTILVGTEGMPVTIGRRIENPPLHYALAVDSFFVIVAGIPFALLLTRQAKSEFSPQSDSS
ncbi:MAG: hypothetical protein ACR2NU_12065 [Aeoliella sp.]